MRLRNVKGAKDKILLSRYNIDDPYSNINNWNPKTNNRKKVI